jgi:hypothetical protein
MKTRLIHVDAPEWMSFLADTVHDFYHLPGYVALCATQEPGEPLALYATDAGNSLLLPLIVRGIRDSPGFDATSPYGYPGPLTNGPADPTFMRRAMTVGIAVLREAGLVAAFVRLHPLLNAEPPVGIGALVHHGETVSVDLTLPKETLWEQTRLNHRRDITRAARLGFVARVDEEWRHLETFERLYRATMARRSAAPFYYFDDTYFSGLRDALGESLHLCVVERDGDVAAAGLFVETNGIVEYHLSGTDDALRQVQPTKLMMHFMSGWAKDRGNRILHLGGGVGGNSDSLLQFKIGFSPRHHTFSTLRMVIDEREYRRLVVARDPHLDPDARSGFFPLYRHA